MANSNMEAPATAQSEISPQRDIAHVERSQGVPPEQGHPTSLSTPVSALPDAIYLPAKSTADESENTETEGEENADGAPAPQSHGPRGVKEGVITSHRPPPQKLRPIRDVLNRLRWDDMYDLESYVLVYKDRFDGIMELPAPQWQTDSTDEEWIPQHRIIRVKREDDGKVVWDRERRYDSIFGSGWGNVPEADSAAEAQTESETEHEDLREGVQEATAAAPISTNQNDTPPVE